MMKKISLALLLLMAAGASGAAWAHGHFRGPRVGIVIGAPLGWPWYYPPPYYYYPPAVAAPSAPPVYVEREPAPAQPQSQPNNDWYYCSNPDGYYPYIKQCPGGWQRVAPQPPQP
jgi:hypothetical protein